MSAEIYLTAMLSGMAIIAIISFVYNSLIVPEYEKGYRKALEDINRPMCVVPSQQKPSSCPRCSKSFLTTSLATMGITNRPRSMNRCPFCGQKLDWDAVDR